MKNIVLLASGSGSNAENIIKYFSSHHQVKVEVVISNRETAGVLERANRLGIKSFVWKKEVWENPDRVRKALKELDIQYIILAGYLLKIPDFLVEDFANRIINIHPALLPLYGGKGMYGSFVHEAVIKNLDKESGITIHFVNNHYDEGEIIFQEKVTLDENETAVSLQEKIHKLEHKYFPKVIEQVILGKNEF